MGGYKLYHITFQELEEVFEAREGASFTSEEKWKKDLFPQTIADMFGVTSPSFSMPDSHYPPRTKLRVACSGLCKVMVGWLRRLTDTC